MTSKSEIEVTRKIPKSLLTKATGFLTGYSHSPPIATMLPCSEQFPTMLKSVVDRVLLDDFFMGDGSGGKRTERLGIRAMYQQLGLEAWYDKQAYLRVMELLKKEFREDQIFISKDGFVSSEGEERRIWNLFFILWHELLFSRKVGYWLRN